MKKKKTIFACIGYMFLLILAITLITSSGHFYCRDGVALFFMTKSLVETGSFAIPIEAYPGGGRISSNGLYYSPYGIGQPLIAVPFYVIGQWLSINTSFRYMAAFVVSMMNCVVLALIAGVFTYLLILLGYDRRIAVISTIILSLGTLLWPYSRFFFSEPLVTLYQLSALTCLVIASRYPQIQTWALLLSGSMLGMAILTRPISALFVPVYLLFYFMYQKQENKIIPLRALAFLLIPITISIIIVGIFNWERFGNPLDMGYGPLPDGSVQQFGFPFLRGLMIYFLSPGKSLFLFSPVLLISVFGFYRFYQRHKALTIMSSVLIVLYIVIYARWCQIEGGHTWGPRFLVPIIPFFFLPFAEIISNWPQKTKLIQFLIILVVIFSVLIQFLGILVNYSEIITNDISKYYDTTNGRYNIYFNPLPLHLENFLKTTTGNKERLIEFRRSQSERKELYIINLDWADTLDLWFLNLRSDGAPFVLVYGFLILLCLLMLLAVSRLFMLLA